MPGDLGRVVSVSASYGHTCAVQADGQLVCFGHNPNKQCDVPADLGPVLAVSTGFNHACAVQADGQLACFGSNWLKQCSVPAKLGPVLAVSAAYIEIPMLSGVMGSSFALETDLDDSAMCHQVWDQLWRFQPEHAIPV